MGLDRAKFSLKFSDYNDIDERLKRYLPPPTSVIKELSKQAEERKCKVRTRSEKEVIEKERKSQLVWFVEQTYKKEEIKIPYDQNSGIYPVKYFEVRKDPHEPNYKKNKEEDEIGLTLWAGWKGNNDLEFYDHEVEINLFILAGDVYKSSGYKVSAEIIKVGGADMKVFFYGHELTDFTEERTERIWSFLNTIKTPKDKIWVNDLQKYLPKL